MTEHRNMLIAIIASVHSSRTFEGDACVHVRAHAEDGEPAFLICCESQNTRVRGCCSGDLSRCCRASTLIRPASFPQSACSFPHNFWTTRLPLLPAEMRPTRTPPFFGDHERYLATRRRRCVPRTCAVAAAPGQRACTP